MSTEIDDGAARTPPQPPPPIMATDIDPAEVATEPEVQGIADSSEGATAAAENAAAENSDAEKLEEPLADTNATSSPPGNSGSATPSAVSIAAQFNQIARLTTVRSPRSAKLTARQDVPATAAPGVAAFRFSPAPSGDSGAADPEPGAEPHARQHSDELAGTGRAQQQQQQQQQLTAPLLARPYVNRSRSAASTLPVRLRGRLGQTADSTSQESDSASTGETASDQQQQQQQQLESSSSQPELTPDNGGDGSTAAAAAEAAAAAAAAAAAVAAVTSSADLGGVGPQPAEPPAAQPPRDKRYHIVKELVDVEKEYVESLQTLVEKYIIPLKVTGILDACVVDEIFYRVPELYAHHSIFLNMLESSWTNWSDETAIGDQIYVMFKKESIAECYCSFVENFNRSEKSLEASLQQKSSLQRFVEQIQRENRRRLPLKSLIIKPVQRIPRYELLLKRLLEHTPEGHPDWEQLRQAETTVHALALKINTLKESQHTEGAVESLRTLEGLLLLADLASTQREYLRHDIVQVEGRKESVCVFTFSDQLIFAALKKRVGPQATRKPVIRLQSSGGQDFIDSGFKYKVWLRLGLESIEISKGRHRVAIRKSLEEVERLEEDRSLVLEILDLSTKLCSKHAQLEEVIKDALESLNRQLENARRLDNSQQQQQQLAAAAAATGQPGGQCRIDLLTSSPGGIASYALIFSTPEKKSQWENSFLDTKMKLLYKGAQIPDFLQTLQIAKIRSGMQFTCGAAIEGYNENNFRDVWICKSDGYISHLCLLSLQPEPMVSMNTPLPGCNSRVNCVCSVPAYAGLLKSRQGSEHRRRSRAHALTEPIAEAETPADGQAPPLPPRTQTIPEAAGEAGQEAGAGETSTARPDQEAMPPPVTNAAGDTSDDDDSSSDSYDAVDPHADESSSPEAFGKSVAQTQASSGSADSALAASPSVKSKKLSDPYKGTMWLGCEDGWIYVYYCTDNIRTSRSRQKVKQKAGVTSIIHLDGRVYVCLQSGEIAVYRRKPEDGLWDFDNHRMILVKEKKPLKQMVAVAGKVWCGSQKDITVVNPASESSESTFTVGHQSGRRSVQAMVCSGYAVWIALENSTKVFLYHALSAEFLLEMDLSAAVNQKLGCCDEIVRQHKSACLRITCLLVCKDLLWVGTSAGVIVVIPLLKVSSTTGAGSLKPPSVTALNYGHTGHVRFLAAVEKARGPGGVPGVGGIGVGGHRPTPVQAARRASLSPVTTLASQMLVLSGGAGFEEFASEGGGAAAAVAGGTGSSGIASAGNSEVGKDDTVNHLLIFQV